MTSTPTPSIQYAWDGPGTLGAPDDALYLRWNNASGRFEMASAGVSDHGGLTGLADDDHAQYALLAGRGGGQSLALGTWTSPAYALDIVGQARVTASGTPSAISSATYALSVQNTGAAVWLHIGNVATATRGAFFGLSSASNPGASFQFWNLQGGTMEFYTGTSGGAATVRMVIAGSGAITIPNATASVIPFTVKSAASQTANLQEWQDSSGSALSFIGPTGRATLRNIVAVHYDAGTVPLAVKGRSGGTEDLQQWQNSAGTVLAYVSAAGTLTCYGLSAADVTERQMAGNWLLKAASGGSRIRWNGTGLAFFGVAPVAQAAYIADPTGGATVDAEARTAITAVITALENYGLLATS